MTINNKNHTIEMTKKFAKSANRFGSDEYKMLQEARKDYPGYTPVIKAAAAKKQTYKGLTYAYMEKYIRLHDEQGSIMDKYNTLRGQSAEAVDALAESCSYQEIKEWFLETFPAISEFHKQREALLNKKAS